MVNGGRRAGLQSRLHLGDSNRIESATHSAFTCRVAKQEIWRAYYWAKAKRAVCLPAEPAPNFPQSQKRNYRIRFEIVISLRAVPSKAEMDFAQITIEYIPAKLCVEQVAEIYRHAKQARLRSRHHRS
jgi:hypothetical protein